MPRVSSPARATLSMPAVSARICARLCVGVFLGLCVVCAVLSGMLHSRTLSRQGTRECQDLCTIMCLGYSLLRHKNMSVKQIKHTHLVDDCAWLELGAAVSKGLDL